MRILDLFSGAGGAAMGYHRAFPDAEIVGLDIKAMPRYPFTFVVADVMGWLALNPGFLTEFDLIHASPPCHDFSNASAGKKRGTGWMLARVVEYLAPLSTPWVVENVETAQMPEGFSEFKLCGSSFGLDVRRHRKFLTNAVPLAVPCDHQWQTPRFPSQYNVRRKAGLLSPVVAIYGRPGYSGDTLDLRKQAMGIEWMTWQELNQAIPPAYTQAIGEHLIRVGAVATSGSHAQSLHG